jgi:hypothetical protein
MTGSLRRVRVFRSKPSMPTFRLAPLLIVLVVGLVALGLAALVAFEPRPPVKRFEVPVPSERFSR